MIQCVIFDMDGVLIDSEPIHMACEREMFRLLGVSVTEEEHHSMIGSTDETMWTRIGSKHKISKQLPELIKLKKELYFEHLERNNKLEPIPYIPELIDDLLKNDFVLAVASSSLREQIDFILNKLDLRQFFRHTVSGEDVPVGKPNPDIFLKAAEWLGVNEQSCLVIEDSCNGVMAAKKANMKCIAYINPNSGKQDLSSADMKISSFNEISADTIKRKWRFR